MIKQSIIIILITASLLICAEFGLRFSGHPPAGIPPFSMDLASPHPDMGFKAYPNISWYFDTTPNGGKVVREVGTTNAEGYRPTIQNADCASCPYIVVIGDSLTFDAVSSDHNTWAEFLARELGKHGQKYKVMNISFGGWSALQEAIALRSEDLSGKKIDFVLYLEVANDPAEGIKAMHDLPAPLATEIDGKIIVNLVVPNKVFYENPGKWKIENFARKYALTTLAYSLSGKKLVGMGSPPLPISTNDSDYKASWPSLDKIKGGYMDLLLGKGADATLARDAYAFALKDMANASHALGAKFMVIPVAFGPYTRGNNADEFAKLLGVSPVEMSAFLDEWDKFNSAIRQIAKTQQVDILNIDLNLFSGMSYREYAATPGDWHFSVKANELLAQEISRKLLEKIH